MVNTKRDTSSSTIPFLISAILFSATPDYCDDLSIQYTATNNNNLTKNIVSTSFNSEISNEYMNDNYSAFSTPENEGLDFFTVLQKITVNQRELDIDFLEILNKTGHKVGATSPQKARF